jgi:hypothetical protein
VIRADGRKLMRVSTGTGIIMLIPVPRLDGGVVCSHEVLQTGNDGG